MEKAEKRLSVIMRKYGNFSEMPNVRRYPVTHTLCGDRMIFIRRQRGLAILFLVITILCARFVCSNNNPQCLAPRAMDASKIFRPPEDCSICQGINEVDRVKNISPTEFGAKYASKGVPVVILDGTKNWTAKDKFNFDFFKNLYASTDDGVSFPDCQFFPYKTEFKSLREALNMTTARARLEPGTKSWYIGWSNCDNKAGEKIREHYSRPYFLPATSENIALSWIFMGGPGFGAHMHVDNVQYPSWQAQLSGIKHWRLVPPPECHYVCAEIEVTVEQGEIIVVDTNRWYHQTYIAPGKISITIGAEFD